MSDLQPQNNRVWDRLFDLLYACDERVTDVEVDADLQRAGIDMRPAYRSLHLMIEQKKAKAQLAKARDTRASVVEQLRGVVAPRVENLREGVKSFIDRMFSGPELMTHHHKLDKAATEEDLQSLMDDLSRLAALREQQKKDDPTAQ